MCITVTIYWADSMKAVSLLFFFGFQILIKPHQQGWFQDFWRIPHSLLYKLCHFLTADLPGPGAVLPWVLTALSLIVNVIFIVCLVFLWSVWYQHLYYIILYYIILYCFLFCFVFFTSIWFEVSVNIVETFRKTLISHCFYSLKEHKKKGETEPRGQNLHVAEEKRSLTRVWCHRTTSEVTQPNHSALIECSGRLHALICYIMFSVYLRFCNDGMLHFAFCMNLNGLTGSLLSSHHSQ